jgi:hypothetical protein
MTDDQKLKALDTQLNAVLATLAKLQEQVLSMKQKLEGANPVADALALFDELWVNRYAPGSRDVRYAFVAGKDAHAIKLLLKTMDPSTLQHRITRYFADRDEFLVKTKHPFNIFISRVNSYAAGSTAPALVLFDCQHEPRCATDIIHTRRAREDRAKYAATPAN